MTTIDYIILGSYLLFLMGMGPAFRSFSKNASDFFRAGGTMIWWVAGASVFMTSFTAWSFTGGAAKAYETGFFFLLLFACNFVAMIVTYFLFAAKFRQMRVVTPVEAIRKRFGPVNEQVYTWLPFPLGILFSGISLYVLSVFTSAVFPELKMDHLIIALGITVLVISTIGGAWAAHGSDFVQMLIFVVITAVMVVSTLWHPQVNGIGNLLNNLPAAHWDWTRFNRPWVLVLFIVTLLINQVIQNNTLNGTAGKYLLVKDGRDAKRVTVMSIICMTIMTPFWILPALSATIVHPDLPSEFPLLKQGNDAAYVAMAITTLPKGLLGLLICGIFSATLTSLTAQLNGSAGILIRNFYLPIVNPQASEKRQVVLGKLITLFYGVAIIITSIVFSRYSQLKLFDLILLLAASVGIPQAVPMCLGLLVRRAPSWSAWSTLAIGLAFSLGLRFLLTPEFIQRFFNTATPLTPGEISNLNIAITTAVLTGVCVAWFFFATAVSIWKEKQLNIVHKPAAVPAEGIADPDLDNPDLDYAAPTVERRSWLVDSPRRREEVAEFFRDIHTPIDHASEHVGLHESDEKQYRVLGMMSLIYGCFVMLMAALPNTVRGHLGLLGCGAVIALVGGVLCLIGRSQALRRRAKEAIPSATGVEQVVGQRPAVSSGGG